MTAPPRIALDAFGGDHCPDVEVEAAIEASAAGMQVILVGDEAPLRTALAQRGAEESDALRIHHASERITMEDAPGRAFRTKPDASMPVAFSLVRAGEADAVVSAGNSGAFLACALFKLGRIKGVERPAITTVLPRPSGGSCALLDMGANIDVRAANLTQFAVMGAAFARVQLGVPKPRVAVLSNGSESKKGTDLTRAADRALRAHHPTEWEYIGYAEGQDLFLDEADVIVTDGFTGNVTLKVVEGTVRAVERWFRESLAGAAIPEEVAVALRSVRDRIEPDRHGGAPLLGVRGVGVVCHGASSVTALVTGLRMANEFATAGLTPQLRAAIENDAELFKRAREEEETT